MISAMAGIIKYPPGKQLASTIAIAALILAGGLFRVAHFKKEVFPEALLTQSIRMSGVVEVTEVLKVKENGLTLKCLQWGLQAQEDDTLITFTDKYILVHLADAQDLEIFPGDKLTIAGWASAIQGPMNPHAFDARSYYRTIGIRHQLYCKSTDYTLLDTHAKSLSRLTARWQFILCDGVTTHTSPEVAQLTNALVFGERSSMNEEIRKAFADSGAMHVLSVSGMHMAIIYSMLYVLLGSPSAGSLSRRMIRFSLYALAIILYMGLTGACPAVVRSGMMILLYLLGKAMGWNTQIWNLLGFAAFLMLWDNPYIWHHIGFQLSFLAMAGILLYAKPIIRYFSIKQIIFQRIWEITAVSIAAQVFILPIILHQFYQFPMTFVASSLVAMPASYVIIFGALANLLLSFLGIDFFWSWFDLAGSYFIWVMKWMAGLNPSMNFSLPQIASVLLLSATILLSLSFVFNWRFLKKAALLVSLASIISLCWHRAVQWNTDDLIIYHQYSGLQADVFINGRCISIQDTMVTARNCDFASRGYRVHRDVIDTQVVPAHTSYARTHWRYAPDGLCFNALRLNIWNGDQTAELINAPLSYVLVKACPSVEDFETFMHTHQNLYVILPAHLDRYTKNLLCRMLLDNGHAYWDIADKGYFKIVL